MARYDEPGFRPPTPSSPAGFDARQGAGPGSPGIQAADTTGPVVGTVGIRTPDSGPRDIAVVTVHSGDTSGMADDRAAHASAISPGPESAYASDGPHTGSTTTRHPNSVSGK